MPGATLGKGMKGQNGLKMGVKPLEAPGLAYPLVRFPDRHGEAPLAPHFLTIPKNDRRIGRLSALSALKVQGRLHRGGISVTRGKIGCRSERESRTYTKQASLDVY